MEKRIPSKGKPRREGGRDNKSGGGKPSRERRSSGDEKKSGEKKFFRKDPLKKDFKREGDRKPFSPDRKSGDRDSAKKFFRKNSDKREFRKDDDRKSFSPEKKTEGAEGEKRFVRRDPDKREFRKDDDRRSYSPERKSEGRDGEKKFFRKDSDRRVFKKDDDRKPYSTERKSEDRDRSKKFPAKKRYSKPAGENDYFEKKQSTPERDYKSKDEPREEKRFYRGKQKPPSSGYFQKKKRELAADDETPGLIRLNRFIANAGICSRREADDYITAGVIFVNGKVITQLGTKVSSTDEIKFHDRIINGEKKIYLVLNKPKDYITTTDDPLERKTVMALVKDACRERIYPVGRLDRATTGVLLFTNDGDLTKRLTHPSHKIKKVYLVELDKPITKADFEQLLQGVELEDGMATVDNLGYALDGRDKAQLIVELHSGRNRIVRRIFEALGYEVRKLDRTAFSGISKKELMRGRWRMLTEKEVGFLKMQGSKPVSEEQLSR